mgnify:CR=1 FL=1|jgi:hypothetical protein
MGVKGMHDIPTGQGLTNRSVRATRAQVVAHLARAEHEKARLERELAMWVANQKQTERRLRRVLERIEVLQGSLRKQSPGTRSRKAPRLGPARSLPVRPREVLLEY